MFSIEEDILTISKHLPSLPVYFADNILNGTGNADPFKEPALTSGLFSRQYCEWNRKWWPFQCACLHFRFILQTVFWTKQEMLTLSRPALTSGLFCRQYFEWNRICWSFRGAYSHFRFILSIFCMKQDMPTLSWHFVSLSLKDLTRRTPKKPQMWDLTYLQYTCRILWRQWYRHCIITIIKLTHVKDHVLLKLPMLRINNNKNNHKTKGSDEPINRYVKFIILFTQLARKVWRYQNRSRKSRRTGNIMAKRKGTKGQAMINKTLLIE